MISGKSRNRLIFDVFCPVFAITPLFSYTIFSRIFDISDLIRISCVSRGQNIGHAKICIFVTSEIPCSYEKPVFYAGSCTSHDGFQKFGVMSNQGVRIEGVRGES